MHMHDLIRFARNFILFVSLAALTAPSLAQAASSGDVPLGSSAIPVAATDMSARTDPIAMFSPARQRQHWQRIDLSHDGTRSFAFSLSTQAARPVMRCSSARLRITPMNKGLGAALGHSGLWYRIHLTRGKPCSLRGYPRVELLDARFRRLPSVVGRGGYIIPASSPIRSVLLSNTHDAYFAIEDQDVPSSHRPCRLIPHIKVTPPGNSRALLVPAPGRVSLCPGPDDVSPVEPASKLS